MKLVEKITLIIYSNIMLILSIIACLLVFNWIDIDIVNNIFMDGIMLCLLQPIFGQVYILHY